MSNQPKTVIEAIQQASKRRAEVEDIFDETNTLCDLSDAYHSFGEALDNVGCDVSDEEIRKVLILADTDETPNPKLDADLEYLFDAAKRLKNAAHSVGVTVDYEELLKIENHSDVDWIGYWSSSSLYC